MTYEEILGHVWAILERYPVDEQGAVIRGLLVREWHNCPGEE